MTACWTGLCHSSSALACLHHAGEQRNREYDWSKANIDPKVHRFGLVDKRGQQCSVKQVGVQCLCVMYTGHG